MQKTGDSTQRAVASALIEKRVSDLESRVTELGNRLGDMRDYALVRTIAFAIVGAVCLAFLSAVIKMVVQ